MGQFKAQTQRNTKPKVAEALAFDPFLSKDTLINQMIRNMINPDNDTGQSYYVGQVVKIIDENDSNIDLRDVFYSPSDNFERATKSVSDKKYNSGRVVLLVHIPSFLTNGRESNSNLNYDNFTKIRIEYSGKEKISVGNLVKIQFRDKNAFYDPQVIEIESVSSDKSVESLAGKAKAAFDQNLLCKVQTLVFPSEVSAIDFKKQTNPPGGYAQALKELDNIFSAAYIDKFKENSKSFAGKNIEIRVNYIRVYANNDVKMSVYDQYKPLYSFKYKLDNFTDNDKKDPWLILTKQDDILFFADSKASTQLKDEFYKYVKNDLLTKFNFSFNYFTGDDNTFELDLNLRFIINSVKANLKDYLDISDKLKDSPTYYLKIPPNSTTPQTIGQTTQPNKCNNNLSEKLTAYKTVYSVQSGNGVFNNQEGYRTQDNSIIQDFYDNEIDTNSYLSLDDAFYIANIKSEKDIPLGSFYIDSGVTNDSYKAKSNQFNVADLPKNLNSVLSFLKSLKSFIENNETLASNNVLVLPLQIFKQKPANAGVVEQDSNSRHFYGRAADIVIYLKLTNTDNTRVIVQMPPEIVALYASVVSANLKIDIGQGIFLTPSIFYNHIELLSGSGLTAEEIKKRVYTGNNTDLEKYMEQNIDSYNRISFLKQYLKTNNNYKILGELPEKFQNLVIS